MKTECMGIETEHPAFQSKLLDPEKHYMIFRDLRKYAEAAGISVEYIYTSMVGVCSEKELDWMEHFHENGQYGINGLIYAGKFKDSIFKKMCALAGCFIRNFRDAKVAMLSDVIKTSVDRDFDPSILLVPNFYMCGTEKGGSKMFDRDRTNLYGFMMDRSNRGKCTIIYVEDMDKMRLDYGDAFYKLFADFTVFKASDLK